MLSVDSVMKYGILGDIHSNLSALQAVLTCFEKESVERIISVGDVVGYGAAPHECIELLRSGEYSSRRNAASTN